MKGIYFSSHANACAFVSLKQHAWLLPMTLYRYDQPSRSLDITAIPSDSNFSFTKPVIYKSSPKNYCNHWQDINSPSLICKRMLTLKAYLDSRWERSHTSSVHIVFICSVNFEANTKVRNTKEAKILFFFLLHNILPFCLVYSKKSLNYRHTVRLGNKGSGSSLWDLAQRNR